MMWCTHNKNMYQTIQSFEWELTSLWQKLHQTDPCIQLVPNNMKPNIATYILNLLNPPSPIPTNLIHYLILKPL